LVAGRVRRPANITGCDHKRRRITRDNRRGDRRWGRESRTSNMNGNPIRHVIIALSLSAILFVIAGDRWSANIGKLQPVTVAKRP
jgi:hypothetical protein